MYKRKLNLHRVRGSNLLRMTKNRVTIRERDSVLILIKGNMSRSNLTNSKVMLMMRRMNGPRVLLFSVILWTRVLESIKNFSIITRLTREKAMKLWAKAYPRPNWKKLTPKKIKPNSETRKTLRSEGTERSRNWMNKKWWITSSKIYRLHMKKWKMPSTQSSIKRTTRINKALATMRMIVWERIAFKQWKTLKRKKGSINKNETQCITSNITNKNKLRIKQLLLKLPTWRWSKFLQSL